MDCLILLMIILDLKIVNNLIIKTYGVDEIENINTADVDNTIEKSPMKNKLDSHFQTKHFEDNKRANRSKRDVTSVTEEFTLRFITETVSEFPYNYEKFKSEYYANVKDLKNFGKLANGTVIEPKSQCHFIEHLMNIGPTTMLCLYRESIYGETKILREQSKYHFRILLIVWGVLFALLFFGWCQFGLCHSLCPKKYCAIEERYRDYKQKLILNPPGTITVKIIPKEDDNSETILETEQYEPSDAEYYLYNILWQDLADVI